jgi:hypothetical protein
MITIGRAMCPGALLHEGEVVKYISSEGDLLGDSDFDEARCLRKPYHAERSASMHQSQSREYIPTPRTSVVDEQHV